MKGRIVKRGSRRATFEPREEVTDAYFGLEPRQGRREMIWINQILQGVLLGGYYALIACGLSFLFSVMRIINLAHGSLAILAVLRACILARRQFQRLAVSRPDRRRCPQWPLLGWALAEGR